MHARLIGIKSDFWSRFSMIDQNIPRPLHTCLHAYEAFNTLQIKALIIINLHAYIW